MAIPMLIYTSHFGLEIYIKHSNTLNDNTMWDYLQNFWRARVKIFHHKSSLIYWYVWHLVLGSLSAKLFQVEEDVTAQTLAIKEEVDSIFVYGSKVVAKSKSKFRHKDISILDIAKIQGN